MQQISPRPDILDYETWCDVDSKPLDKYFGFSREQKEKARKAAYTKAKDNIKELQSKWDEQHREITDYKTARENLQAAKQELKKATDKAQKAADAHKLWESFKRRTKAEEIVKLAKERYKAIQADRKARNYTPSKAPAISAEEDWQRYIDRVRPKIHAAIQAEIEQDNKPRIEHTATPKKGRTKDDYIHE